MENLINYSREVLQKTYHTLSTQAFKLICGVVVWILDTFVKHLNLQVSDVSTDEKENFRDFS